MREDNFTAIPEVYPTTVEECLKVYEKIRYKSYGFPVFFFTYDHEVTKCWCATFRNPANFSNPDIRANTPLEACHKMFDFLKTLPANYEKQSDKKIN